MSTLDGKTIASTFKDLLQVSNNNVGVDETIRYIEDGEGTVTALAISTSMVELGGDLVPAQDVTFDIGSATHRFKDLYLSGNTIHLGDSTFSTSDLQALKDVQTIGVSNLPTFSEVATPAQGAKADSAIQPNDTRDLMPFSNMSQDIGSAANHWMHVYTHHLSAHGDVIVGGSIHGPATLTIDPAAVGDNTGKVVIAGDLQVDGETTTVNSTELKVSDKTITVGDGATDATQVDGAGVEVAGSGATITYTSDNDSWNTNKTLIAPTLQSENTVTEQLNVTGNAVVDQMDLTAIEQVKNDQAVAVFIYDTSKDSDGGAWRHRVTHTSWYNEPLNTSTRGGKREFPAVAVIVAEADRVTIYDGDEPELPMWMVFTQGGSTASTANLIGTTTASFTSVTMLNGLFLITENTWNAGLITANFISEEFIHYWQAPKKYNGNISQRNDSMGYLVGDNQVIVDGAGNDVTITVLPGAPLDPLTQLPVPTIAVATGGGLSLIRDTGEVFNHTILDRPYLKVDFDKQHDMWIDIGVLDSENQLSDWIGCLPVFSRDYNYVDGSEAYMNSFKTIMMDDYYSGAYNLKEPFNTHDLTSTRDGVAISTTQTGLMLANKEMARKVGTTGLNEGSASAVKSYITSTHNTGNLCGNIKHASMGDTTVQNLVASPMIDDTDLVVNPSFSDTDENDKVSDWIYKHGAGVEVNNSTVRITVSAAEDYAHLYQKVPVTAGRTYRFKVDFDHVGSTGLVILGKTGSTTSHNSLSGLYYREDLSSDKVVEHEFLAETDDVYIRIGVGTTTIGSYADFSEPVLYQVRGSNHVVNGDFSVEPGDTDGSGLPLSFAWETLNNATLTFQEAGTPDFDTPRGLIVTPDGVTANGGARQLIKGLIVGARYELTYTIDNKASEASSFIQVQGTPNHTSRTHSISNNNSQGTYTLQFVAGAEQHWLALMTGNTQTDKTCLWSDISIKSTDELIINGGFDQGGRNWSIVNATSGLSDTGQMRLTNTTTEFGYIIQDIETTPGSLYHYSVDFDKPESTATDYRIDIKSGSGEDALNYNTGLVDNSTYHGLFQAKGDTTQILLRVGSDEADKRVVLDNMSVKLAVDDLSYHENNLVISGAMKKQPVAPGAELTSYSGFDEYNYVYVPHNTQPDQLMNPGIGDFYVSCWVKASDWTPDRAGAWILKKIHTDRVGTDIGGWSLASSTAGDLRWQFYANGWKSGYGNRFDCIDFTPLETNTWIHITAMRHNGLMKLFKNGVLVATGDATGVDVSSNNTAPITTGGHSSSRKVEMSLVRFGLDAHSDEQVLKNYQQEKELFKPGAKCTLYGDTDVTTAIAVDDHFNVHVGTADGRSVFRDLTRIEHDEQSINNYIATGAEFTIQQ